MNVVVKQDSYGVMMNAENITKKTSNVLLTIGGELHRNIKKY